MSYLQDHRQAAAASLPGRRSEPDRRRSVRPPDVAFERARPSGRAAGDRCGCCARKMRALAISTGKPARPASCSMFGHNSVSMRISSRGRQGAQTKGGMHLADHRARIALRPRQQRARARPTTRRRGACQCDLEATFALAQGLDEDGGDLHLAHRYGVHPLLRRPGEPRRIRIAPSRHASTRACAGRARARAASQRGAAGTAAACRGVARWAGELLGG